MSLNNNLTANSVPFRFGVDADGNYGYILADGDGGADTVHPFSGLKNLTYSSNIYNYSRFSSNNDIGTRTYTRPLNMPNKCYAIITGCFQNYWDQVTWSVSGGINLINDSNVSSLNNSRSFKEFITITEMTSETISLTYKPYADHTITVSFIGG